MTLFFSSSIPDIIECSDGNALNEAEMNNGVVECLCALVYANGILQCGGRLIF